MMVPQNRLSTFLLGGGSSGGTTDYNALSNKPQIGGVELSGNKTLDQLGIQPKIADVASDKVEIEKQVVAPKVQAEQEIIAPKVSATTVEADNLYTNTQVDSKVNTKLDKNQGSINAGKYLSVASNGYIQCADPPSGGGEGGSDYTLPQASENTLGGIKAKAKTTETVEAAIDTATGKIYVPTYPTSGGSGSGGYDISSQTAWQLIVEKTLSSDEASVTSFAFTSDTYPLIEQCNEFFIAVENPTNKGMPYWRIKVNNLPEVSNGGGNQGLAVARVSLKGSLVSLKMSNWFNISLASAISANSGVGNLSTYELYKDLKDTSDKITKFTISSYTTWLDEGANIRIFGWKL